jgi:predicted transcriptional regulator
MSKKGKISSAQRIAQAAEMYFDGMTQAVIAQKLDLNQSRISQMQSSVVWQETIARLENLKQKAQAEAERQQKLAYSSDFDRRFEQSRQMVSVCATTYSKLMLVINKALDKINKNPAEVDIKILPNLIKVALQLQQEASGRHYDEIEALKVLADAGWLPRSVLKLANDENLKLKSNLREAFAGIIPDRPEEEGRGLTAETAAAIRWRILGIEPADVATLSAELESRPISNQDLREITENRD